MFPTLNGGKKGGVFKKGEKGSAPGGGGKALQSRNWGFAKKKRKP